MFVSEVFVVIPSLTPEVQWNKVYDGTARVWAWSAQQTSDGGCIFAGEMDYHGNGFYAWLLKADSDGNVQWNRTFGGSGNYEAGSVQQTSDGGYIFAGHAPGTFFMLVKLDQDGSTEWNKSYGDAYVGYGYYLRQTSEGGYIIAGYGYSSANSSHYIWLAKTDSNGNIQWNRTYGNIQELFWGPFVQQTSDGGCIIVGSTPQSGADKGDAVLIKLDQNGDMQWSGTYGGSNMDWAKSVLQTSDGGYIFSGSTFSYGAGESDVWLVNIDANGIMQWSRTIGGPDSDHAYLVQKTSDRGYILIGESMGSSLTAGYWLMKTDSYGNFQWKEMLRDPTGYYVYHAVFATQTSDGGYMVAGYAYDVNHEGGFWLMKLASSPSATTLAIFIAWTLTMVFVTIASFVLMEKKPSTKR